MRGVLARLVLALVAWIERRRALAADYQINPPTARAAGTDRAPKDPDKRRRRWHPVDEQAAPILAARGDDT